MKSIILILSILVCTLNSFSEEFEKLNYEWSKINLPNDDKAYMFLITEKDEMFIFGPSILYYSSDFGKTIELFKDKYGFVEGHRGLPTNYIYDNKNGIYFFSEYSDFINVLHLKSEGDSLVVSKETVGLGGPKGDAIGLDGYEEEIFISEMLNDNYIFLASRFQVWIFDILKNEIKSVKYLDDIAANLHKNGKLYRDFFINFIKVNNSSNRIDIYYEIDDNYYNIYSKDNGINWDKGEYNKNCIPYRDGNVLYSSYSQWNKNDRIYYFHPDKLVSIDTNCNIFSRNFNRNYSSSSYFVNHNPQSANYVIDSLIILPASPDLDTSLDNYKILLSKDYGHNFYVIDNLPFKYNKYNWISSQVFKNGKIVLFDFNFGFANTSLYVGDPLPVSVSFDPIASQYLISPNPASDYITIKTSYMESYLLSNSIELFDVLGIKINSINSAVAKDGYFKIDISNLEPGVYFIRINDKIEKFVKI